MLQIKTLKISRKLPDVAIYNRCNDRKCTLHFVSILLEVQVNIHRVNVVNIDSYVIWFPSLCVQIYSQAGLFRNQNICQMMVYLKLI